MGLHYCFPFLIALPILAAVVAGEDTKVDRMVVSKSKHQLLLLRGGTLVRSYRVALGRVVGKKSKDGDGKTPEGEYIIDGRNANSRFHRSLHISYPNAADREWAAREGLNPGGDIMIHGLPQWASLFGRAHTLYDWTQGCIAVTNSDMDEIWRLVHNGLRVTINP
jgi:murein L,D-transpeptidase YafK